MPRLHRERLARQTVHVLGCSWSQGLTQGNQAGENAVLYDAARLVDPFGDLGLRQTFEYRCTNQHELGTKLAQVMEEEHGILISGKWHRVSFSPSLILSKDIADYILDGLSWTLNGAILVFLYFTPIKKEFEK